MKAGLNKRACRKYADPGLKFNLNNGLLNLAEYEYIVRTEIHNIAGTRALLLLLYPRKRLLSGDFTPRWTMFHSKDDFTTLSFREDGTTTWLKSAADKLDGNYGFQPKCAFYTLGDKQRVTRFCKSDFSGWDALNRKQWEIQSRRELEGKHKRQKKILQRMADLPKLPRGVKRWLHRDIIPQYIFYEYQRSPKQMAGYCTACGQEVEVSGVKNNTQGSCPLCRRKVIFKAKGRAGFIFDRKTAQVMQKLDNGELVVRILKAETIYRHAKKEMEWIGEATRVFICRDERQRWVTDPYHCFAAKKDDLTPWRKGYRPAPFKYQYNFLADVCGYLYCPNLDEVLSGTPWQYSQLKEFHLENGQPLEVAPYLSAYLHHPKIELLVKLGFTKIAADLIYRDGPMSVLKTDKRKVHEILGVLPEDVGFIQKQKLNLSELRNYQKYVVMGLKNREQLLLWQRKHSITDSQLFQTPLRFITVQKLIRYIEEQYEMLSGYLIYGILRYKNTRDVLNEYSDYLRMCIKENYDMGNDFILLPRNLQEAHDRLTKRIKLKADIRKHQEFTAVYQRIRSQLDFEADGLKIVCPQRQEEIIAEGQNLHHCVGSYVDRVVKKECIILFLRHTEDPQTPFFTIEVRNGKVAQVRGKNNCSPTKEVESFMKLWEKKILSAEGLPAAA